MSPVPTNWHLPTHHSPYPLEALLGHGSCPALQFPPSSLSDGADSGASLDLQSVESNLDSVSTSFASISRLTSAITNHHFPSVYLPVSSNTLVRLQTAAKMPGYRIACPFSSGGLTKSNCCEDGSIHMETLRRHLRHFHICDCPDPSVCTKPRHVSKELVDRMIVISYDKQVSRMDRWAKMYQTAFPTHRRVPGPCVPRVRHTLSLAQLPGSEFKNAMIRRLVRSERWSAEKAKKDVQTFLNRLPLFYDVLSHPEVWKRCTSSVSDESGDEVDEPSTTQPVEVAEPLPYEEPDLSIQQDDGATDEKPDTQAQQETPPSAPTSS